MKPHRVLLLAHPDLVPSDDGPPADRRERHAIKTESDVIATLRASGHEVLPLGVQDEVRPIRDAVEFYRPHVVFNLLEEFHGNALFDAHVVAYLELLKARYTGCGPTGLLLSRSKALSKKLLSWHRIRVPGHAVFPRGQAVRPPRKLAYPCIVKSLVEHASYGIAQASVVDSPEKLRERVAYLHEKLETDAIAEEYVDGRELYVGVLGNQRRQAFPVWELRFENLPDGAPRIATAKVKHDPEYQERAGITDGPAADLDPARARRIRETARRICHVLELDGYARIDFRLTATGELYFVDANPNPDIASTEEYARAARLVGLEYPALLDRILKLALERPN